MSHPTDPTVPEAQPSPPELRREIRRRGRLFGVEYDLAARISPLSDLVPAPPSPALHTAGARVSSPGGGERAAAASGPRDRPAGEGGSAARDDEPGPRPGPDPDRSA